MILVNIVHLSLQPQLLERSPAKTDKCTVRLKILPKSKPRINCYLYNECGHPTTILGMPHRTELLTLVSVTRLTITV